MFLLQHIRCRWKIKKKCTFISHVKNAKHLFFNPPYVIWTALSCAGYQHTSYQMRWPTAWYSLCLWVCLKVKGMFSREVSKSLSCRLGWPALHLYLWMSGQHHLAPSLTVVAYFLCETESIIGVYIIHLSIETSQFTCPESIEIQQRQLYETSKSPWKYLIVENMNYI